MIHRKETEIKTKYHSISECVEGCLDIRKKRVFVINGSRKIYGEVFDNDSFVMSSRGKLGTLYRFVGNI